MNTLVVSKVKLYQEARRKNILQGKDYGALSNPGVVAAIGRHFLQGDTKESMLAFAVNTKNELIAVYSVFSGAISSISVSTREIVQFALLNNAAQMFILHNHPSGHAEPSEADISFTRRLQMAGSLMDVDLLDHVIVTDDDYASIRTYEPQLFDRPTEPELESLIAEEKRRF